jgi:hypothetical protein
VNNMNNAMKLVLPKLGMLAAALVLAGCSLAPTYKVPETPTASTFKEAEAAAAEGAQEDRDAGRRPASRRMVEGLRRCRSRSPDRRGQRLQPGPRRRGA